MRHCYALAAPDLPQDAAIFGLNGDFYENLRIILDCGYDGGDLITCDPGAYSMRMVAAAVERSDFVIPMICTGEIVRREGLELASPDPEIRDATVQRFYAFLDLASIVGAGVNIGRSRGCIHVGYGKKETDDMLLDSLARITRYAERRGVRIALEPVTRQMTNYLNTLDEVLPLVERIGSASLGYMLDTQHVWLDEPDVEGVLQRYARGAMHIHLVDDQRGPVGSGGIDLDRMLRAIVASGYNGTFSHECLAAGYEREAMQASMETMRPLMERYYGDDLRWRRIS